MCKLIVTSCLFIAVSAPPALAQTTRVVDADGQGTAANCNDATATFATVASGIAAAANGDTVLVCPGTYVENIDFGGKAIAVRSTGGPAVTILDGNAVDSVVKFITGESSMSILEGFTIRNGRPSSFGGGGIKITATSPVIRSNLIVGNSSCDSSGIYVNFGSPLIEYNTIANNTQVGCGGGTGGGIGVYGESHAIIRHNNIYNNTGAWLGGGIGLNDATFTTIEHNLITGNSAQQGGAIGIVNTANESIIGNVIVRNQAASGGGIFWLIPTSSRGILVVNNTIADNSSPSGSGVFADGYDGNAALWNNIIVAASGQTAVFCGNFNDVQVPSFRSNDVFSATGAAYGGICTDRTGTNGNISTDPLFIDPATNDYHVMPNSATVDAGDGAATELPFTDLDGHARVLDGNGDSLAVVDIGADETFSTGIAPAAFGKSSPIDAVQGQTSRVLLAWDASAGATGYEFCFDTVNNNACDGSWIPAWNATRATLFGLDGGATYYWQVRAINAAGITYADGGVAYWSFTTVVPVLTRVIELSGDLDFGSVLAGQFVTRTLTISNTGNDLLTVSAISYPTGFSGFFTGTVAAGASRSVTVTFFASDPGTYSGNITVTADQTGGATTIPVSATALPVTRIMTVSGDLAFGNVRAGATATRTLTITNRGNDALNVFGMSLPTGFSATGFGTIAPGGSRTVTVTFAPTISSPYVGTAVVIGNQTFGGNQIPVSGTGTVPLGTQVQWQNTTFGSLDVWYVEGVTVTATLPLSIDRVDDPYWRVVGTGDLNGDGMPDIVWQHAFYGWLGAWFLNGNNVVSTQLLSIDRVTDLNWVIRGVGDIDGDGYADLIWQHRTQGWIAAWRMNGAQVMSTVFLSIPQTPVEWEVVGAGDLNGDGKADLVFQHQAGWLAAWYLDGPTVTSAQMLSFSRITDLAWHITGVGDCNGDGRADLLWRNETNGYLGVWFLNGVNVLGQSLLSTTRGDLNWRMVGPG